ncbi:class I SAM-dependent methyltransferase [Jiangella gansuensis]|uniref:class I SAM-dependent methyltransferase n=1 Tax=Jiangella gansuensis TaxID=281473 RepID=UPI0004B503C9|nr:class I SAM-dependent methyltransferase [Jiangella gansuensis]
MSDPTPPHIARLVPRLGLAGTERVLELGGAPGVAAAAIARLLTGGGHVTVVDRSATGVRRTAERNRDLVGAGRVTVLRQDLAAIEPGAAHFPAASFDVVLASNVNVFWTHPARANVAALAALLRVPGGRLHLFYGYGGRAAHGAVTSHPAGDDGDGARSDVGERVAATLAAEPALTAVEVHRLGPSVEIRARRAAA